MQWVDEKGEIQSCVAAAPPTPTVIGVIGGGAPTPCDEWSAFVVERRRLADKDASGHVDWRQGSRSFADGDPRPNDRPGLFSGGTVYLRVRMYQFGEPIRP
ncbi:hypothetical protein EVAR_24585_1 [Eumeta japonica]|uniref:Uncharacterized protein n=1 Tax=Eumeta variegata TaxID=151549 RepID=A0A4C1W4B7_EUMVA|nr:hypothetical protein EVAR_24585_1 [Eumeta japonica]